jgi:hypothetical protein
MHKMTNLQDGYITKHLCYKMSIVTKCLCNKMSIATYERYTEKYNHLQSVKRDLLQSQGSAKNRCSRRSRRGLVQEDKRTVFAYTHGLFIT